MEPKDDVSPAPRSRRLCLTGALVFMLGALLPSFRGYAAFNGIETALLFLNDGATFSTGILLLASYALSALCAASCLRSGSAMKTLRSAGIGMQIACFMIAWAITGLSFLPAAWVYACGLAGEIAGAAMSFSDKGRA
jgi:hypothetical protein